MAGIPKIKITFDADFDELKRGVKGATNEVESFGSRVADFGKKAGAAFAIAGAAAAAYAGKLLVDGVKAAIEDEKAQVKLATSLQNTTGATNAQIAAVENQITKTSLLTGLTDDELRPSLERLVRSTKDVEEAQRLQSLAIDIAAGSGKSLEAVSNALGKAYEGNATSLGKLGIGISAAELKTMSFDQVTGALSKTFEGQASKQADTFAGKMQRLNVAFDEGKETVGSFVLDAITPLVSGIVNNVIPRITQLSETIGKKLAPVFANLATFFKDVLIPIFGAWWGYITEIVIPGIVNFFEPILQGLFSAFGKIAKAIKDNEENLAPLFGAFKAFASFVAQVLAPVIGNVLGAALKIIGDLIAGLITGFSKLIGFIDGTISAVKRLIALVMANPVVSGIGNLISSTFGGFRANGGSVNSGTPYVVGERGAELFVPKSSGTIVPNGAMGGNTIINLTVNGALDPISTARQITNILNREATINGSFNRVGSSLLVGA
jgi:hypothetical protein